MEALPLARAVSADLPASLDAKQTPPPKPPAPAACTSPLQAAWPRCAQLAGASLVGALAALLAVNALASLRGGARPSEMEDAPPLSYRVDLNEASRAELVQLPGIGAGLADRIEQHRKANGDFGSIEDLRNVPGIGPARLEKLRPFVTVKPGVKSVPLLAARPAAKSAAGKTARAFEPIDINSASTADLQSLPGIGPVLSKRIIDEREKRPFDSVAELRRVPGIGPKTLQKIEPFVTVVDK